MKLKKHILTFQKYDYDANKKQRECIKQKS